MGIFYFNSSSSFRDMSRNWPLILDQRTTFVKIYRILNILIVVCKVYLRHMVKIYLYSLFVSYFFDFITYGSIKRNTQRCSF